MSACGHKTRVERAEERAMEQVRAGQRVRVEGRDEVFVVLQLDHERQLANLMRVGRVHKVESGIPMASLRPLKKAESIGGEAVSA